MSELPPAQLSTDGRFAGWAAVVAMLVFPPIGLFMVGLTTWKTRSRLLVRIGGSILWIVAVGLLITSSHAGPTGT